jgi:hypothetical protein
VIKKVFFVVLGFGMITAGIAGITTSFVDRKNQAALQQLEKIQDEAKTAATEEQRKLVEKQQEIDRLARRIEAERLHLQEDRRRVDQHERSRMAAIKKQKSTATEPKTATRKDYVKGKANEVGREGIFSSRPSSTTQASRRTVHEEDFRRISQKAGLEAARSFAPVRYYNRTTRELVVAEPFKASPGSVLVRIRIWKGERLAQDTLINFSKTSLGDPRGCRPYL